MIKIHVEQKSEAWFLLRLGRITGTRFAALMAGESTDTYKGLITDLAGEIITGEAEESYSNAIMERGTELEPDARNLYVEICEDAEEVGMCLRDEDDPLYEWIGVSPDGMTAEGLLEIKCPLRKTHLNYIEKDVFPNQYKWQVQGQLFVTGLPYCDFMSYCPSMKPFIIRVYPDKEMHEQISERLFTTILKIKEKIKTYEKYNFDNDSNL
jgi:putative phage-type endonuclease